MRFALWILFLCSTLPLLAQADSFPENAQIRWERYFAGTRHVPDPELDLELLLEAPNEHCREIQRSVVAATVLYGRKGYHSDNRASRRQGRATLDLLHGLEDSGDVCFESAARAYVATSLHLLNPANENDGHLINNNRLESRPMPMDLELTLLGAALLNYRRGDGSSVVQFLTPSRRSHETPIWQKKTDEGDAFLVSAGYDCVQRGIVIDPYLMPLNLAAVFVHELDHLFRDRIVFADGGQFGDSSSLLPLLITTDETLASVVAASYQRHMRWFRDFRPSRWIERGLHPFPFRLVDDLTLFRDSPDSPMNVIWHSIELERPYPNHEVNASPAYFLSKSFLLKDSASLSQTAAVMAAVNQTYEVVHAGYFDGETLGREQLRQLDAHLHSLREDPLTLWLQLYAVGTTDDDYGIVSADSWVREVAADRYNAGVVHRHANVRIAYNLNHLFDGLDFAFEHFFASDKLSPYCGRYLEGLRSGELDSYIGNRLSSGFLEGETAIKPGETGVKSDRLDAERAKRAQQSQGKRTGRKQGETGVKGDEMGIKPALVRPCLNIGPNL